MQKEYQDFMEKVRSKAQSAIDTANREYQGAKTLLTRNMGIMVDYLQASVATGVRTLRVGTARGCARAPRWLKALLTLPAGTANGRDSNRD